MRSVDLARGEIALDVVIHEGAPGSDWATSAEPGSIVGLLGPGGGGMPPEVARSLERQEEDPGLPPKGLGTRVVMHLVRELSGQVSVASSPDTGTRITLRIPLNQE